MQINAIFVCAMYFMCLEYHNNYATCRRQTLVVLYFCAMYFCSYLSNTLALQPANRNTLKVNICVYYVISFLLEYYFNLATCVHQSLSVFHYFSLCYVQYFCAY